MGRAPVYAGRREINLRVSSLPTAHGKNLVLEFSTGGARRESAGAGMSP